MASTSLTTYYPTDFLSKTERYIADFNAVHRKYSVTQFIHDNPTAIKVLHIARFVMLGIYASMWLNASNEIPYLFTAAVIFLNVMSTATWIFMKMLTCEKHAIAEHVYRPKIGYGGRLVYEGDLPVLILSDESPLNNGFAHGYLFGKEIYHLRSKLNLLLRGMDFFETCLKLPTHFGMPSAKKIPHIMEKLKRIIPQNILREMEGLALGYNTWATKSKTNTSMTLEDVIQLHLIPDSKFFHQRQMESELAGMACTTILDKDPLCGRLRGIRNMDWMPFGDGGARSILIIWEAEKVASLTVPGLIGVTTGWNRDELFVAMNVCPAGTKVIKDVSGIPSSLFNRYVLQNAKNVQEALELKATVRPLGPYHLTMGDKSQRGVCVSFYQDERGDDFVRGPTKERPLEVLNWCYPLCSGGFFNSAGRHAMLSEYFSKAQEAIPAKQLDREKLLNNVRQLQPLVNSWITLHSVYYDSAEGRLEIGWDNGYAGSSAMQTVHMSKIFDAIIQTGARR